MPAFSTFCSAALRSSKPRHRCRCRCRSVPMPSRRRRRYREHPQNRTAAAADASLPFACGSATASTFRSSACPTRRRSRPAGRCARRARPRCSSAAKSTTPSARDGARYADLDSAYVYREHLVPNCTCNGKDAFGLATFDVKSDPTLRPGDIVATKNGFMAYAGKRGDRPPRSRRSIRPRCHAAH